MESNEYYMQKVLSFAAEALEFGELPIAAVVVLDNKVISKASTSEKREERFLGHAELVALERADQQHLTYEMRTRSKLFTNLEPCLMCMGAAMSFFLGEIFFGLESPADGAIDLVKGWNRQVDDMPGYQLPRITGGLLRAESVELFEKYVSLHESGPMRDWAETLTRLG